ncbi:hypothetical protein COCON_G00104890 [Conger conger]|uniref:Uncharacterized protein n=1 Tax=Conger conger TaxID=82655 RepID=A0A9Q1DIF7_CONCO|nr:hypothetical protein COCON_G00104890 [Conger conger]
MPTETWSTVESGAQPALQKHLPLHDITERGGEEEHYAKLKASDTPSQRHSHCLATWNTVSQGNCLITVLRNGQRRCTGHPHPLSRADDVDEDDEDEVSINIKHVLPLNLDWER